MGKNSALVLYLVVASFCCSLTVFTKPMLATFNFYLPDEERQIICEKDGPQFQQLLARGYYYEYQLPDRIGGHPGGVN